VADQQTLRKMDADEAFKLQAGQMERDQVRVDMTKEGMLANKGELRAAHEMLDALRREDARQQVLGQARHHGAMAAPAQGRMHTPKGDSLAGAQATAKKHGAGGRVEASKQAAASAARPEAQPLPPATAPPPATAAPPAPHVAHVTKEGVGAAAAVVAQARQAKAAAGKRPRGPEPPASTGPDMAPRSAHLASNGKEAAASRRAFSRAVDSIGMPPRALAEEHAADEGGSPGREMELASSAVAFESPHGIVDKPYRPSASEEVASLVFEADGRRHQPHTAALKAASHASSRASNYDATRSLPWIERSQILNW